MTRTALFLSVIALVAVTAGCRMCSAPYDYYGPVFDGGCGDPDARAGSVLSPPSGGIADVAIGPGQEVATSDAVVEEPAPPPAGQTTTARPVPHRASRPSRAAQ
jgi:hypothetical protein